MPKPNLRAQDDGEYPPEARFGWDMIHMTLQELDALCDYADAGLFDEAEAVVDRAEERMFGAIQ